MFASEQNKIALIYERRSHRNGRTNAKTKRATRKRMKYSFILQANLPTSLAFTSRSSGSSQFPSVVHQYRELANAHTFDVELLAIMRMEKWLASSDDAMSECGVRAHVFTNRLLCLRQLPQRRVHPLVYQLHCLCRNTPQSHCWMICAPWKRTLAAHRDRDAVALGGQKIHLCLHIYLTCAVSGRASGTATADALHRRLQLSGNAPLVAHPTATQTILR